MTMVRRRGTRGKSVLSRFVEVECERRTGVRSAGRQSDNQHRNHKASDDALSGRTEENVAQRAPTAAAHDHEVDLRRARERGNLLGGGTDPHG
jgi:hypothetical protein